MLKMNQVMAAITSAIQISQLRPRNLYPMQLRQLKHLYSSLYTLNLMFRSRFIQILRQLSRMLLLQKHRHRSHRLPQKMPELTLITAAAQASFSTKQEEAGE